MHMQIQKGIGASVRRSEHHLFAYYTGRECSMESYFYSVKVQVGQKGRDRRLMLSLIVGGCYCIWSSFRTSFNIGEGGTSYRLFL